MGEADYFILIGGNETGPWTLGQVQAFWRAGAVTLETLYAQPGASEWKPLAAILDVAPPTAATPPARLENGLAVPGADDAASKPMERGEMDLTKLRQWLREKLAAIGLVPQAKKTTAKRHKFERWLCGFSDGEQKAIFGENNVLRYRKRDLTWQGLILELECLAASTAKKPQGELEQPTPENALWIMEAVCGAEPRMKLDYEKIEKMGKESGKRAAAITLERRRLRALGIMDEPHV